MESAKTKHRHRHSEETKRKIAKSNTGKNFSEERRKNIGKAREIVLSDKQMTQLHEFWSKHYLPARWICEQLDLSERVYLRIMKLYCSVEQVKFLPQEWQPIVFESIIGLAQDLRPYKDIAELLELEERQVRRVIEKLSPFYVIAALPRPRPEHTEEHKIKSSEWLKNYNKENPKKREGNPNWKGGITQFSDLVRVLPQYKEWRMAVMRRDGFQCIHCGVNGYLHVDHIYPFCLMLEDGKITTLEQAAAYIPLWNTKNGRTLCELCHRKTETYGKQRRKYK